MLITQQPYRWTKPERIIKFKELIENSLRNGSTVDLEEFLSQNEQLNNPDFLLQAFGEEKNTTYTRVLNFPATNTSDVGAKYKKAERVFEQIRHFAHAAIEIGTLDAAEYATYLTKPGLGGFTILQEAVRNWDSRTVNRIFKEVETYASTEYPQLLAVSNQNNFNVLHSAVIRGDMEIIKRVFEAVQKHLTPDVYQSMLMQRTDKNNNIFHFVAKGNSEGANPFIAAFVMEKFQEAFKSESRAKIEELLGDFNILGDAYGYNPIHRTQPEWLKRILDLDYDGQEPGNLTVGRTRF